MDQHDLTPQEQRQVELYKLALQEYLWPVRWLALGILGLVPIIIAVMILAAVRTG